jgi:hypothetical protein
MSRYIDADKLKKHASHYVRTQPHFHYGDWDNMCISGKEVDEIIDTCPTADVVEVVRCRDCKHFTKGMAIGMCKRVEEKPIIPCRCDNYCMFGERSENEK